MTFVPTITGTLCADKHPGGYSGQDADTGRLSAQPLPFDTTQVTHPANRSSPKPGDSCHPLAAGAHPPAIAFALRGREHGAVPETHEDGANVGALRAANGGSSRDYVAFHHTQDPIHGDVSPCLSKSVDGMGIATSVGVRRLTPTECERLQGFPDGWTDVPYRGKPAADGPRYKALGNSMAVPVMRWIGACIATVDAGGTP